MCDGMRIDRRLVLIGVILVVLSMTMATQYATTKVNYSFAIVHPSNADIRFIGSDNSSDGTRVLRITNNNSGTQVMTINLGNWAPNQMKNYTAVFGIVNEEKFKVNITYMNVSGVNASYMSIYLHGDRTQDYLGTDNASIVKAIDNGSSLYGPNSVVWTLGAGDGDANTMNGNAGGGSINTPWDSTANVRYNSTDTTFAANETADFVWVGVCLNLPSTAGTSTATGTIYIYFKSTTF
jgi:hypothetical protein